MIDCDFVGNLGVILFNHSGEAKVIHRGDRIAQLIVEKICYPTLVEVSLEKPSDEKMDLVLLECKLYILYIL